MSNNKQKYFLVIFCSLLLLSGCHKPEQAPPPDLEVKVEHPLKKKVIEWDEYTGRFQSIDRVEVRSRVSGYLERINFRDGQMVHKGDVLFVIDQRPFQAELESAEAQLEGTQARRELANKNLERAKKLLQAGAISKQDFDSRFQEEEVGKAASSQAAAAVQSAKLNLGFTEVRAPISGRISRNFISEGNLISGGGGSSTLLTTIVSIDPIYFYFDASESNLLKYIRLDKSGKRTSSRTKANPLWVKLLDEEEFTHEGHMDFVDNEIDAGTGTMMARAVFPNSDGLLEPGMFGKAKLPSSGEYEAMLVPDEIIGADQSRKYVFVVNDKDEVEIKFVELGPLHDEKLRIIKSGLTDADKIITSNLIKVRPGIKVKPIVQEQNAEENEDTENKE